MNSDNINELAESIIPKELVSILKVLNSEFDLAVISSLEKKDLTFSELKDLLKVHDNKLLAYHLKKLAIKGLIRHYYKHSEFEQNYSYYSISKLAEKLIKNINNVFEFDSHNSRINLIHPIRITELSVSPLGSANPLVEIVSRNGPMNANQSDLKVEQ
jgi:DNA-binding HxlR family transcriptional regulator